MKNRDRHYNDYPESDRERSTRGNMPYDEGTDMFYRAGRPEQFEEFTNDVGNRNDDWQNRRRESTMNRDYINREGSSTGSGRRDHQSSDYRGQSGSYGSQSWRDRENRDMEQHGWRSTRQGDYDETYGRGSSSYHDHNRSGNDWNERAYRGSTGSRRDYAHDPEEMGRNSYYGDDYRSQRYGRRSEERGYPDSGQGYGRFSGTPSHRREYGSMDRSEDFNQGYGRTSREDDWNTGNYGNRSHSYQQRDDQYRRRRDDDFYNDRY